MTIAVGSDTIQNITKAICSFLEEKGITLQLHGALAEKEADYVDAAHTVAESVAKGAADHGLIFCNTGTGVTIIANKVHGVRAAFCVDTYSAKIARLANNANVLVLSMRYTGEGLAKEIVDTFLSTPPSEEPHRKNFHRKTDEVDDLYRRR